MSAIENYKFRGLFLRKTSLLLLKLQNFGFFGIFKNSVIINFTQGLFFKKLRRFVITGAFFSDIVDF
jgi:hypothetical protein